MWIRFRCIILFLFLIGWHGSSLLAAGPAVAVVDFNAVVKGLDKFASLFDELNKTREELRQCEVELRSIAEKQEKVAPDSEDGKQFQTTVKKLTDSATKLREAVRKLKEREEAANKDYHNPILLAVSKVAEEEGINVVLHVNGKSGYQLAFASQRSNITPLVIKKLNESDAKK